MTLNKGVWLVMTISSKANFTNTDLGKLGELVGSCRHCIHLQPDWFSGYIHFFKREKSAFALNILSSENRLLGTLALDVKPVRGTRFFSLRRLLPLAAGPSDFFDIPCQAGLETQVANSLVGWLSCHSQEWDSLYIDLVPESSSMWRPFTDALSRQGWPLKVSRERKFFYVDTSGDWEVYQRMYFDAKNKDLRKDLRRIEREGKQVRLVDVRSGIGSYLPQLFAYYGARRIQKGQFDVFDESEWRKFLSDVVEKFESKGWVRLSLLMDQNDEIWAHQLDWLMKGIRYHYFHSINEAFRTYSPGKVLLYLILKNAFNDPDIRECNFMRGESSYKENFANQSEAYVKIDVQNPKSYRNKLLKVASRMADFRDHVKGVFK